MGYKGNFDAPQELGGFGDALKDRPTAVRGRRSRKKDDSSPSEPTHVAPENTASGEQHSPDTPLVVEGAVSQDLPTPGEKSPAVVSSGRSKRKTVKETEMMREIEEISRIEEISVGGTANIEAEVIGAIAGIAAQSVEGVASLGTASLRRTIRERMGSAERRARGVKVDVGSREAILDINIRVIYGYSIPITVVRVREIVADQLLRLCGLVAKEINVKVTAIEFPERMPGRVQ